MKTTIYIILACLLSQLSYSQDNKIFQSERLEKKWETAPIFNIPESVCFDDASGILYISNIAGKPTDKDGNGYISMMSPDGTVSKGRSITGLNAPKGMGIYKGIMYVTDIDRVAEIDLKAGSIVRFFEFPEAKFLNDIAIGSDGTVYISDMASTRIYRIYEGKTGIWLDDPLLTNPNGLFVNDNELLIGCGKIVSAGLADRKLSVILEETGGIDGLEVTENGEIIFSDWQGNIYISGTDKQIEKLLDTTPAGINAADIEYIPSLRLILVPTFSDNRVAAYELK